MVNSILNKQPLGNIRNKRTTRTAIDSQMYCAFTSDFTTGLSQGDVSRVDNKSRTFRSPNWLDQTTDSLCEIKIQVLSEGNLRIDIVQNGTKIPLHVVIPSTRARKILQAHDNDLSYVSRSVRIINGNQIKVIMDPADQIRHTSLTAMRNAYPTVLLCDSNYARSNSTMRNFQSGASSPKAEHQAPPTLRRRPSTWAKSNITQMTEKSSLPIGLGPTCQSRGFCNDEETSKKNSIKKKSGGHVQC
jgi:hypothetical protein